MFYWRSYCVVLNHFALIAKSLLLICSFRKSIFSSNKMIKLSELFDLLTFFVVYYVSSCFLKTFTSARNDFLNARKSSKNLSWDLLESLSIAFTLSVTSFSFITSRWYSLSSLLPVPTIRLLSLVNWDSFGSDKQVLFPSKFSFTSVSLSLPASFLPINLVNE